jgi:hypothetical protein
LQLARLALIVAVPSRRCGLRESSRADVAVAHL